MTTFCRRRIGSLRQSDSDSGVHVFSPVVLVIHCRRRGVVIQEAMGIAQVNAMFQVLPNSLSSCTETSSHSWRLYSASARSFHPVIPGGPFPSKL